MNILICNDDGYLAEGIAVLARTAGELANVRVVAPESDRSGVSNSLTLNRPLSLKQAGNGFYYVNGTPTDCIHIALHALPDFKPDLVLSGINHGANMGDDTLYSGTVAAATEAYLLGIPAVAFSLNDRSGRYWQTAEAVVGKMLAHLLSQPPKLPVLWNVNIPAVDTGDIRGLNTVRLGRRHHIQMVEPVHNPRGEKMYWIGYAGGASDAGEGTDFDGNARGWVTVTPLSVDLTDYPRLDSLAAYWQGTGL